MLTAHVHIDYHSEGELLAIKICFKITTEKEGKKGNATWQSLRVLGTKNR